MCHTAVLLTVSGATRHLRYKVQTFSEHLPRLEVQALVKVLHFL